MKPNLKLLAELHQRNRRTIDRDVDEDITLANERLEQGTQILRLDGLHDELHSEVTRHFDTALIGRDNRDAIGTRADMPHHQRQNALPDAAKTHKNNSARKINVNLVIAQDAP